MAETGMIDWFLLAMSWEVETVMFLLMDVKLLTGAICNGRRLSWSEVGNMSDASETNTERKG